MEVLHSCLAELSLDNHSAAELELVVGLIVVEVGEHMSVKHRINLLHLES
jgi:hypothetical protein